MSLVFDSVWRWRDELGGRMRTLDNAVKNPTSPEATTSKAFSPSVENTPSSRHASLVNANMLPLTPGQNSMSSAIDNGMAMDMGFGSFTGSGFGSGLTLAMANGNALYADSSDFFDPLGFVLDGITDYGGGFGATSSLLGPDGPAF